MPSGSLRAQSEAGTDKTATRPISAPMTTIIANIDPIARGKRAALKKMHSGSQKEIQHEREHDGKDDRTGGVKRRKEPQRENAAEKNRLRIGRQRHLRVVGFGQNDIRF